MTKNSDERNVDPMQEMLRIVDNFSKLKLWDFKESFRSEKGDELIFDSEWCRMNITWGGWDPLGGNSISIYYGRLHAPNESAVMILDGEECYAWHGFDLAIQFLDGRSPIEASKIGISHPLIDKFYSDEYLEKFNRRQPEWLMEMHMEIWDYYGKRFFELFDLRHPNLWEQYQRFLRDFYDIKGRRRSMVPARDKVC